jgi:hypothetical protein
VRILRARVPGAERAAARLEIGVRAGAARRRLVRKPGVAESIDWRRH